MQTALHKAALHGHIEIVQYLLRPANLHDLTVGYELNRKWAQFGGPKVIGDKGYACLGFVFPPKKNSRYDSGWRDSRHPKLRKRIETVFSQLVEAQIRSVQAKTLASLHLWLVFDLGGSRKAAKRDPLSSRAPVLRSFAGLQHGMSRRLVFLM